MDARRRPGSVGLPSQDGPVGRTDGVGRSRRDNRQPPRLDAQATLGQEAAAVRAVMPGIDAGHAPFHEQRDRLAEPLVAAAR